MSQPPPFSPTVMLMALGRERETALADAVEPLGLTTRQFSLLGHIHRDPGISFSELARRSHITVQSAHKAVSAFVAEGIVDDTTAHAGSSSTLRVTTKGASVLAQASAEVTRLDAEFSAQHQNLTRALREHLQGRSG